MSAPQGPIIIDNPGLRRIQERLRNLDPKDERVSYANMGFEFIEIKTFGLACATIYNQTRRWTPPIQWRVITSTKRSRASALYQMRFPFLS